jgi:hypothetical protein
MRRFFALGMVVFFCVGIMLCVPSPAYGQAQASTG